MDGSKSLHPRSTTTAVEQTVLTRKKECEDKKEGEKIKELRRKK
jgi:hypothetical protein